MFCFFSQKTITFIEKNESWKCPWFHFCVVYQTSAKLFFFLNQRKEEESDRHVYLQN